MGPLHDYHLALKRGVLVVGAVLHEPGGRLFILGASLFAFGVQLCILFCCA